MITGKNFIGYSLSDENDKTFTSLGNNIYENKSCAFHETSANEIDLAVKKANNAFNIYRHYSIAEKVLFIEKIAAHMADAKSMLVEITAVETKLSAKRLEGEIQRTINQIKLFSNLLKEGSWVNAVIDTAQPERLPLPKPDLRQMQIPIGAVGVFGASNFPYAFSVAGGDTISALAAGCPVVYKAHPGHPATSELVGEIIIRAAKETGMPDGIFSLLQGASYESGLALVIHPLIKAIAFTGSFAGGKALYDAAAKRPEPIPVYAEMGSVNPVIVLPEILEQNGTAVADKLAFSNTLDNGQFCTNPGLIILQQTKETESFLSQFSNQINNTTCNSMLTSNIYNAYHTAIERLSHTDGVELKGSGQKVANNNKTAAYMFITKAAFFLSNDELSEEVFGPASLHVITENKEELLDVAEKLPGQLTISIWGTDNDFLNYKCLLDKLELKAGRIICNGIPTGVEVTAAMVHGGPYPATTNSKITSVGTNAIYRFTRAVCYQNFPEYLLAEALQNKNILSIWRKVNGNMTKEAI